MQDKTKWIAGGALVAAVLAGGAGVAVAGGAIGGDDDAPLTGDAFDAASAAAVAEAGGGTVQDAELDDGRFDMEVRRQDGSTVEVTLDRDLEVIGTEDDDDQNGDDADDLTGDVPQRATDAAVAEVGEGTVTDAEQDEDGTFELEVTTGDGRDVDVRLDQDYTVIGTGADD